MSASDIVESSLAMVKVRLAAQRWENCINISELATGVARTTGTGKPEAKAAIAAIFEQIAGAAAKGEDVSIAGFGKFVVKDRPERQGRNPATGEAMTIAASKKVSFTPAKGLKDKL